MEEGPAIDVLRGRLQLPEVLCGVGILVELYCREKVLKSLLFSGRLWVRVEAMIGGCNLMDGVRVKVGCLVAILGLNKDGGAMQQNPLFIRAVYFHIETFLQIVFKVGYLGLLD